MFVMRGDKQAKISIDVLGLDYVGCDRRYTSQDIN